MSHRMPRRVETDRLVLRPWRENDVDRLLDAITSSLEHLRAWLPWALHEPESREAKLDRIRVAEAAFESGERWFFGLFDPGERRLLGGVGIEPLSDGVSAVAEPDWAREIGYWIRADSVGRGLCSEAVGALTALGFRDAGLGHLEIQCDPGNRASSRIPERLGYRHVETHRGNKRTPTGELRDTMVWVMGPLELDASLASAIAYRVRDD